jgi:hypothetical protein
MDQNSDENNDENYGINDHDFGDVHIEIFANKNITSLDNSFNPFHKPDFSHISLHHIERSPSLPVPITTIEDENSSTPKLKFKTLHNNNVTRLKSPQRGFKFPNMSVPQSLSPCDKLGHRLSPSYCKSPYSNVYPPLIKSPPSLNISTNNNNNSLPKKQSDVILFSRSPSLDSISTSDSTSPSLSIFTGCSRKSDMLSQSESQSSLILF